MRRMWPYMVACLHLCKRRALQTASLPLGAWIPLKLSVRSRELFWLLPKTPLCAVNERWPRVLKETNERRVRGESKGAWNISFCPLKDSGNFSKFCTLDEKGRDLKMEQKAPNFSVFIVCDEFLSFELSSRLADAADNIYIVCKYLDPAFHSAVQDLQGS